MSLTLAEIIVCEHSATHKSRLKSHMTYEITPVMWVHTETEKREVQVNRQSW